MSHLDLLLNVQTRLVYVYTVHTCIRGIKSFSREEFKRRKNPQKTWSTHKKLEPDRKVNGPIRRKGNDQGL